MLPGEADANAAPDPLALAAELGFALAGVAAARPSGHADHVRAWLAEGRHGEMHYLADPIEVRLDPAKLMPEGQAKRIIVVADAYPSAVASGAGPGGQGAEAGGSGGRGAEGPRDGTSASTGGPPHGSPVTGHRSPPGRIARYAWGDDYHKVMKKRLFELADALREHAPDAGFRCCVDTAPLLEREHAAAAGLGWVGKHTLLIHPRHGSYLLLGAIVTDLDLPTTEQRGYPAATVPPTDHCGSCTRCIDACPTGCIFDPRSGDYPHAAGGATNSGDARPREQPRAIDAARCISYLTLEHRSAIEPDLHGPMGDWLIGCDVCQEVCPYNNAAHPAGVGPAARQPLPIHLRYRPRPEIAPGLDPMAVLSWTEDDRRAMFTGSALKRVKLDMLHRNALIVLTNQAVSTGPEGRRRDRAAVLAALRSAADDPARSDPVRTTAEQCLDRLTGDAAGRGTADGRG